jgi:NAD(P)-dependent dehydrogenase (short-subunit alcohol dehydrogenase family)
MMDLGLKNRVALVTGAGSQIGFGREIALLLAKEGCEAVAVTDVNLDDVSKTAAAVKNLGTRALAVKADVTREDEVGAMVDRVAAEFGRIDILCNVAGGILHKDNMPLETQDEETWDKQISLNLFGTMLVTRAVLPIMRQRRYGTIVNIGSGSTHQYTMGVGMYAISKAAIDVFTKQLAMAEAKSGIRANCVPTLSEDETKARREAMARTMPLGRIGTAADVAYATAFLASDLTGYVTGQVFHVSGGSVM